MKNLSYFPYERNKYFYGKLLSVEDFETEQRYMNDKRRLGNRFLHGWGVVCGMDIVQVDDCTFSMEAGIAIDFSGREIVAASPALKKLSEIEGFDAYTREDEELGSLYLCIEYEEREREPVYNVAGDSRGGSKEGEFNKIAEGYHLFLTNEQPGNGLTGMDAYYEELSGDNLEEAVWQRYCQEAMERAGRENGRQNIYLAELTVIRGESAYMISRIRSLPFKQHVYNGTLALLTDRILVDKLKKLTARVEAWEEKRGISRHQVEDKRQEFPCRYASGAVTLDMGIGGSAGQKFFSEEIVHGLGLGRVSVILGEAYDLKDDSMLLYGGGDVFEDKELSVPCRLAARVNPMAGTFVIGMSLLKAATVRCVKIYWTAFKDEREEPHDEEKRELYLKPEMASLKLRENFRFESVFTGAGDPDISFLVKEAEGGTIDSSGMYTAPNVPGIYEVTVQSKAYPELKASAFAVVRDV